MDIEGFAVGALLQRLAYTDNVLTFVNQRDKEFLWDGHIYICKDANKTKEQIERLPIQVKGQISKKRQRRKEQVASYSIKINDLESYYKDGGVIYFVVEVPKTYIYQGNVKIFYALLLPFDIRKYLDKARDQKTISIDFALFPEGNETRQIKHLLVNALNDRKKQAGFCNIPPEKLEEYCIVGKYPWTLEFSLDNNTKNFLKDINDQKPYIYAKVSDGISVPINKINNGVLSKFESTQRLPVSVSGKKYYDEYKEQFDVTGKRTFYFGIGVYFIMENATDTSSLSHHGKFTCEYKGTLNQQITDTDFYCKTIANSGFEIDGKNFVLKVNKDENNTLSNMNNKLTKFQRFRQALNNAGYSEDISLDGFDNKTWELVDDFVSVFLDKKEKIFCHLPEGTYYCKITFGSTAFPILVCKTGTVCNLYNPYTNVFPMYGDDEQGNKHPISPYVLFDIPLLSSITYLNFEAVFTNLTSNVASDTYRYYLNIFLLRILTVCDKGALLCDELQNFALKIAKWLYDTCYPDNKNDLEISLLNLMQTKKRLASLAGDDVKELYSLLENTEISSSNRTGLYILTGEFDKAKKYYGQLSAKEKENFLTFPIMRFWNTPPHE